MLPSDDPRIKLAAQVRDQLARLYLHMSGVSLIDIGYDDEDPQGTRTLVVRIHVKDEATLMALEAPKSVNEIPIQVLVSNYELE